jgi:midasin (ATPase involved in ribosome maturation)
MNQQKAVKLLEFVACLNDALFSPTRFGADGASWEMNLRDIIRWLKLISNVSGDLHLKEFTWLQIFTRSDTASCLETYYLKPTKYQI